MVKNGRKRLIVKHIVTGYQHALRDCLERAGGNRDAYIFPSTSSRGGEHLCVRTLQYTLEGMLKRTDISRRVTLTTLRLGGAYMPANWNAPSAKSDNPDLVRQTADLPENTSPAAPATPQMPSPDKETTPEPVPTAVPESQAPFAPPAADPETAASRSEADAASPAPHRPVNDPADASDQRSSRKPPSPG